MKTVNILIAAAALGIICGLCSGAEPGPMPAERILIKDASIYDCGLINFEEIVFVKRIKYNSNHYYTDYINSQFMPGGNICILNLKTGKVREVVKGLDGGVFGRFDLSFDATRIVFAWKKAKDDGYRIYECNIDGSGLRQLTFPPANEKFLQKNFRVTGHYHHGTDDMHPCYLPDGGIAFISTRCQFGILCDGPDDFTTTVIYRMDGDGRNMEKLTNSSVSEASPTVLPDGRIMYTRWEYVDKGAVSVKCLWAMKPDGSASSEIYANDISLPPTFIYGRPIPEANNKYVVLGTPHCPQNAVGTVIRLDMNKNIRTREPMTYLTPYIDIRSEPGFHYRTDITEDKWSRRLEVGPVFKDPFPLSEKYFLVSANLDKNWRHPTNWSLNLLNENGKVIEFYRDKNIGSFMPMPLNPRHVPPVLSMLHDETLAKQNTAQCIVTNIYHGMENTPIGSIKHLRILEQMPRPWAAQRRWGGDVYDQQHATITKDTHLGLKVLHGIVPVEADGSAYFTVPADKNIIMQALDENYMAVQTERTYVNYRPGEVRSCIGCHETSDNASPPDKKSTALALRRSANKPMPQPGDKNPGRPLDYFIDVQPVWDKHCVSCHNDQKPNGLNLSGELTNMFNVSYENLVPERRKQPRHYGGLLGPVIGENHPKTGNVHYLPARSMGSHASLLVALCTKGKTRYSDTAGQEKLCRLLPLHKDVDLSKEELLKITTWVDTNCQYYGTYYGRKNLKYKEHPNFRPVATLESATSYTAPLPEDKR